MLRMNTPETCRESARAAHGVHDARCGVGAGETHADGAVDDRENYQPPARAPKPVAKNVIWIGVGGEGGHVACTPANRAGIGSEDVEETDATQRKHDRLPDILA